MTTTQRPETIRPNASPSQPKRSLGPVAAGVVAIVTLGAGLTALILGVTGDTDTQAPSPNVPPAAEVPFDLSDRNAREGIDRKLYELVEREKAAQ
jgi:hypothetical protein